MHRLILPLLSLASLSFAAPPTDDPAAEYKLSWTSKLPLANVIDISTQAGADWDEKLSAAQAELSGKGGGTVYFPAGNYEFKQSIKLKSKILLRGEAPKSADATKDSYSLSSKLEFPKYEAKSSGSGTPIDTAFRAIELEDPSTASQCGIIHLSLNRAHVVFVESEDHRCGSQRMVLGCVFKNSAYASGQIPDKKIGQHDWQRFTWRFGSAIDVKASEDLLVARNRLAKSGEDNFTMNGYLMLDKAKKPMSVDGVVFDYDNRPGIYANHFNIGGAGGSGPDGTPESHPEGFRKGTVIADNFIYSTGRCAIGFCGMGVICKGNVIRMAKDVWRPTTTGTVITGGSATNDNRALEMRGWGWQVVDNDYEVHRNWAFDRKYLINDGEGMMHEDHANSIVKDSVLRGNKGNSYISIYKTAGVDGLVVENNEVPTIMVVADRNVERFPIKNVTITGNTTTDGKTGLHVGGSPSSNIVIQNNKSKAGDAKLLVQCDAKISGNSGYKEDRTPPVIKPKK
jgi:hypothetical protein